MVLALCCGHPCTGSAPAEQSFIFGGVTFMFTISGVWLPGLPGFEPSLANHMGRTERSHSRIPARACDLERVG